MAMASVNCLATTQSLTIASASKRPVTDFGISSERNSRVPTRNARLSHEFRRCGSTLEQNFFSGRSVTSTNLNHLKSENVDLVCRVLQTDVPAAESTSEDPIEKMKRLVDIEGGNSLASNDEELFRFLRAASNNEEKAAKAFASHQHWKQEFVPKGYVVEEEIPKELEARKAYWISQDKKGRPVLYATGRNHAYNDNFDEFKRFVVYAFSRLISEATPTSEQFICIVDLKGLGLKNLDAKSFLAAFEILQKHYPQRVEKVFMVNVPFIFNGVWKVVKPFIDEDTKNRIVFVDKKKLAETLSQEIDIEFLPKDCGGKADLLPLQDAVTPNWPPSSRW